MADPIIGKISVGDGATFTPAVDSDGVISWTNNKNLPNPASVDIPQAVMDRYLIAPIASPAFTGNPTAPTQAKTDDSTKLATTAYVKAVVADYLELTGGSITGDVDITGDLSVTGTITGNVTGNVIGNVTGDVTGTASGNLALSGGTMTGNIAWAKGEVGYRSTTHTAPYDPCRQMIVTAGTVDSEWDDGNAKLALHTYDSTGTNTAENGAFVLQASDGNGNAPFLEGKPSGDLKWSGNSVITSALTGNVLEASGNMSTISAVTDACSILTHDAGVWLIIGHSDLSGGGSGVYNTYITDKNNSNFRYVRSPGDGGGGTSLSVIRTLAKNEGVKLRGYVPNANMGTFRGKLQMVRLA